MPPYEMLDILTVINSCLPSQLVPVMLALNPGPHLAWQ